MSETPERPSTDSTDTIAMIVEMVFGLFGMLGMGWIYVGRLALGAGLFIGWLVLVLVAVLIATGTLGVATPCCAAVMAPLGITAAIVSGIRVRDYVRSTGASGSVGNLVIAAVAGGILLCLAVAIPLFALGGLAAISGALEGLQ